MGLIIIFFHFPPWHGYPQTVHFRYGGDIHVLHGCNEEIALLCWNYKKYWQKQETARIKSLYHIIKQWVISMISLDRLWKKLYHSSIILVSFQYGLQYCFSIVSVWSSYGFAKRHNGWNDLFEYPYHQGTLRRRYISLRETLDERGYGSLDERVFSIQARYNVHKKKLDISYVSCW